MHLTLGFSPCPNDTFIFDALVNAGLDTGDLSFEVVMEDVETLNRMATRGILDVTKLSYASFLHLTHQYALLHAGSALGRGVGPLLLTAKPLNNQDSAAFLQSARIAIPGQKTTANLLLSLAFQDAKNKTEVVFSAIEAAILDGTFDAGLVIHESRFTYANRGLHKLLDLGEWWEESTTCPIPLGGIVGHRRLPNDVLNQVDKLIAQSLALSWKQYPTLSQFITSNAQEMEDEVMRQHINLYVNDYSMDLGKEGELAIDTLFKRAVDAGIIPANAKVKNIFY